MAWTRSLGPASEQLRDDTFPIVEYLKQYPPPVGLTLDPPNVTASQVASQTTALADHIAALNPNPDPQASATSRAEAIDAIGEDITGIWASGRSIERVMSLHAEYERLLRVYDRAVQAVEASGAGSNLSAGRLFLANIFNLLLGAVIVAGLAALLTPKRAMQRGTQS